MYDNGRPDMPKVSLRELITEKLLFLKTDPAVTDDYMCTAPDIDYTTGIATTTETYCVQPCNRIVPVQSNPSPNFCYHVYKSSFFERITSYLAFLPNYIQEAMSSFKEYSFCSPDTIASNNGACPDTFPASATNLQGCRPDGKGVLSLPPGAASCIIFLNGHDWPAGATCLIAATSLAGTSTLGLGMGLGGVAAFSECPAPFYCSVNNRCCLIVGTSGGLGCPSNC